ncbi:FAD-binding oxidoreductase [Nonomuraea sp. NPDC050451]|uniref:FAD-binding oxidoreductase n=1 Tax=Nonomuraea sp. NPDC050451 TaxID=3364364 RepID=UPI003798A753
MYIHSSRHEAREETSQKLGESGWGQPPAGLPHFERGELPVTLQGRALLPEDDGYSDETRTYNLRIDVRPGVVIAAASARDVQPAVRLAAAKGAPIAAMATGHAMQPVPIGPDAVLVSTRAMRGITVEAEARTARIEAGVTWGEAVAEITKFGLAPLNGASPSVGVVGFVLAGGHSPTLGRAYGYAADHVNSIEVVTADGKLRTVTAVSDPELFFGLRGGKGNFGIVTAVEIELFPITTLYGGSIFFPGKSATAVLDAYREWVKTVPDSMSSSAALLRMPDAPTLPEPLRGKQVVSIRISCTDPSENAAALVEPLRTVTTPIMDTVREMPYADCASIHSDPVDPTAVLERAGLLRELTPETVDALVAVTEETTAPPDLLEIRHLGGAFARQPGVPNAISYRDAAFTLFIANIGGSIDANAIESAQTMAIERLRPWCTGYTLLSFMSDADTTEQGYTPEVYRRLASLKQRVDPFNLFRLNHNICPEV